ncbi:Hypothetical_protein [Hexamita inflata]|uniref:Hypothetical_protein n=1 Tax=Hexamita inflata TaxID=28002 RepID=A0AA86P6V8_9EUKA|nr:Hypothetical protein HINF_LOCUS19466 [Hexamita inflata]
MYSDQDSIVQNNVSLYRLTKNKQKRMSYILYQNIEKLQYESSILIFGSQVIFCIIYIYYYIYDGTTQVDSRIDRLAQSSRVTPLDVCTRVVGCLGCGGAPIGVSKTNDHSRELTVPVQKTELVQTKVK